MKQATSCVRRSTGVNITFILNSHDLADFHGHHWSSIAITGIHTVHQSHLHTFIRVCVCVHMRSASYVLRKCILYFIDNFSIGCSPNDAEIDTNYKKPFLRGYLGII